MVCVLAVSARLPPNQNVLLLKKLGIRAAPQSFDYLLIKRVSNHKRPPMPQGIEMGSPRYARNCCSRIALIGRRSLTLQLISSIQICCSR